MSQVLAPENSQWVDRNRPPGIEEGERPGGQCDPHFGNEDLKTYRFTNQQFRPERLHTYYLADLFLYQCVSQQTKQIS